jgi:hypothetical protein
MSRRGRKSKEETMTRRRQVWELMLRGIQKGVMAKLLDVDPNTITQDVKAIRADHAKYVGDLDVQGEFGDALAKFDHLFQLAISDYSSAERNSDKVSFMGQANAIIERKLRFMMDTGMLPKAAQKIDGSFVVDGMDIQRASTEELKNKRDNIMKRLGIAIPSMIKQEEN